MQVKVADSDQRGGENCSRSVPRPQGVDVSTCFAEDRKLFVGMISRSLTEDQLRAMFEPYGEIEDLTILRNQDQTSRGCAFVKYSQSSEAEEAVSALHHSQTMEREETQG